MGDFCKQCGANRVLPQNILYLIWPVTLKYPLLQVWPWSSWCLKSLVTRLLVQQLTRADIKGNIHITVPFQGNHWWPVVSTQKGPEMQKVFPCHNIIHTLSISLHTLSHNTKHYYYFVVVSIGTYQPLVQVGINSRLGRVSKRKCTIC